MIRGMLVPNRPFTRRVPLRGDIVIARVGDGDYYPFIFHRLEWEGVVLRGKVKVWGVFFGRQFNKLDAAISCINVFEWGIYRGDSYVYSKEAFIYDKGTGTLVGFNPEDCV